MHKFFRACAVGLALTAALTVPSLAAEFTESADHLHELGLFQGTQQGYELDRAPTRAEAAAMLVRLLGKETEAKQLAYEAPFTDLQNWEKPYVQYLYENGLTTGATATTFEPEQPCTAQMYGAFLLRALGYFEVAGDFTYREATAFAEQVGVYDKGTVDPDHFLRDHVAAASYTALALSAKETDITLLDQLVQEEAVDKAAANPYQKLFATYNAYRKATEGMEALTAMQITGQVTVKAEQENNAFTLLSEETSWIDKQTPALLTQRIVTMQSPGIADKTFTAESYTADGVQYSRQNGQRSRREILARQMHVLNEGYARVPLVYVQSMTRSGNQYEIAYSGAGMARLRQVFDAARSAVEGYEALAFDAISISQTVSAGRIVSQQIEFSFSGNGLAGTVASEFKLQKVGEAAAFTPPSNLDQYPLVK